MYSPSDILYVCGMHAHIHSSDMLCERKSLNAKDGSVAMVAHPHGNMEPELRQTHAITTATVTENFPAPTTVMSALEEREFGSALHAASTLFVRHPCRGLCLVKWAVHHAAGRDGGDRRGAKEIEYTFAAGMVGGSLWVPVRDARGLCVCLR